MSQPPMIAYAAVDDAGVQTFRRRLLRSLLRGWLASLLGVSLLVGFVILFEIFQLGPLTAALGVIACAVSTTVAAGALRAARRQRAMTILTYCEQGIRLEMPLPEFLNAVAMNESPRMARRLRAIVRTMMTPASLSDALHGELIELPRRITNLLRNAEVNGTLAPSLRRILNEAPPRPPENGGAGPMPLAYVAIMCVGITMPILLIAVFVMPKLSQIFHDFALAPPWTWTVFYSLSGPFLFSIGTLAVIAGVLTLLSVLERNARWIFFRQADPDRPLKGYTDRILWHTPLVGRNIADRDWADVCQVVSDGLGMQRPLDVVLREATSPHLNGATIERLDRWGAYLQAGEHVGTAARAAGVPRLISGLIGTSGSSSESLAPTFAFLARHYQSCVAARGAWLAAAMMPLVTLIAGGCVLCVALFIWVPLCALIDAIAPYPMRL